jgi:hypothetical protein
MLHCDSHIQAFNTICFGQVFALDSASVEAEVLVAEQAAGVLRVRDTWFRLLHLERCGCVECRDCWVFCPDVIHPAECLCLLMIVVSSLNI